MQWNQIRKKNLKLSFLWWLFESIHNCFILTKRVRWLIFYVIILILFCFSLFHSPFFVYLVWFMSYRWSVCSQKVSFLFFWTLWACAFCIFTSKKFDWRFCLLYTVWEYLEYFSLGIFSAELVKFSLMH